MNFYFSVIRVVGFYILFLSLTTGRIAAQPAQDLPQTLPAWLAGRSDLLPPITTAELNKMEQAWPRLQVSDVMGNEPPEYWSALQTVVDLGEKASLALVWLYAQDAPRLNPSTGIRKSFLISRVFSDDTISGPWMLPLLRYRLQWMEGLLARGEHGQLESLSAELGAIQGYMNTRGDESDYRMVMDFIARLAASNDTIKRRLSMLLEPEYDARARATDEWRRRTRPQLYAYHEMAKLTLTARGGDLTKAAKLLAGQIDSLAWAFPSLAKAESTSLKPKDSGQRQSNHDRAASTLKKPSATTSDEPSSSTPWLVWALMIAAAIALILLFLKKRK